MIKAVDVGGNESEKPAVVVLQLGDALQDNVIEEDDLAAAGFPGPGRAPLKRRPRS